MYFLQFLVVLELTTALHFSVLLDAALILDYSLTTINLSETSFIERLLKDLFHLEYGEVELVPVYKNGGKYCCNN